MMPHALTKALAVVCLSGVATGFAPSLSNRARCRSLGTAIHVESLGLDFAAIDIAEDAPREVSRMEGWAAEGGVQRADGFGLATAEIDGGEDVYAVTQSDVATGTPVLFVPEHLILSSSKAMAELRVYPGMMDAERDAALPEADIKQFYLVLKLLKEIQEGRDSPWFPWLDSLPRRYSNAAAMTDFCLQCLPPLGRKLAGEERDAQRRLADAARGAPFLSDGIRIHPGDLCAWACQVVATRSVETEDGDLKIVPVADYFNHGGGGEEGAEVEAAYDDAGNYYAYVTRDVGAGSALRRTYADPRNPSHLLARYGFLDEESPATYCKLLPRVVNQDMLDLGYAHDRMLFYRTGEVADEVWDIFLYQHLSSTNIDDQRALMQAHRNGDYDAKLALHEKHYAATSAALLEHVDGFLADVDRVIKKAETIGVSDPNSIYVRYEHPRLPLIHRHNLFVREAFQAVRSLSSSDPEVNWKEATRVTVQECDETECAIAECVQDLMGNWACEGGLGPNWDGSEREKTKTIIAAQ